MVKGQEQGGEHVGEVIRVTPDEFGEMLKKASGELYFAGEAWDRFAALVKVKKGTFEVFDMEFEVYDPETQQGEMGLAAEEGVTRQNYSGA